MAGASGLIESGKRMLHRPASLCLAAPSDCRVFVPTSPAPRVPLSRHSFEMRVLRQAVSARMPLPLPLRASVSTGTIPAAPSPGNPESLTSFQHLSWKGFPQQLLALHACPLSSCHSSMQITQSVSGPVRTHGAVSMRTRTTHPENPCPKTEEGQTTYRCPLGLGRHRSTARHPRTWCSRAARSCGCGTRGSRRAWSPPGLSAAPARGIPGQHCHGATSEGEKDGLT